MNAACNRGPGIKAFNDTDRFNNFVCGVMFTSYLKKTLRETRKNYYSREKRHSSKLISLSDLAGEPSCEIDLEDMGVDVAEKLESLKLFESLRLLSGKQRDVVFKYYILEINEVEISRSMGVSKQAVNRIRKRALAAMLKNIGKDPSGK